MRRGLLLAASLVLAVVRETEGAVFCATGRGALHVRERCRRRERPVDAALLAPLGARGERGDAGVAGPMARIVDAAGRRIGSVISFGEGGASLLWDVGGHVLALGVDPERFSPWIRLVYAEADCAGAAYIQQAVPAALVRPAAVVGTAAYFAGDPVAERRQVSEAVYAEPGTCDAGAGRRQMPNGLCCGVAPGGSVLAGPATSVDVSTIAVEFPLHLESTAP
ncbi:MAG: hypothetical protein U0807_11490 [Candidatus Binatia bacterium]